MTNKKKELNDEELKKVSGGFEIMPDGCYHFCRPDEFRQMAEHEREIHYKVVSDTYTPSYGNVYCEVVMIDSTGKEYRSNGNIPVSTLLECIKVH